jgi:hypothetical protein
MALPPIQTRHDGMAANRRQPAEEELTLTSSESANT